MSIGASSFDQRPDQRRYDVEGMPARVATILYTHDSNDPVFIENAANAEADEDRLIVGVEMIAETTVENLQGVVGGYELSFDDEWHDGFADDQEPDPGEAYVEETTASTLAELRYTYTSDATGGTMGQEHVVLDFSSNPFTWERNETLYLHSQNDSSDNLPWWNHIFYVRLEDI